MLMPSRSPLSFEGVPSASVVADTAETFDLRGGILRVEIGCCGLWVVGGVVVGGNVGGDYERLRWMRARGVCGMCQWHRLNEIFGGCEGIGALIWDTE